MIKNNKGFMMAEVVVVSTVVVTVLVAFYVSYGKLYKAFNERKNYYDVDGVYAIKYMIHDFKEKNILNNILENDDLVKDNYLFLIKNEESETKCQMVSGINLSSSNHICNILKEEYGIKNMLISRYGYLNELKKVSNNKMFNNYIEYLSNNNIEYNEYDGSFIIILEYNNGSNYSSMILR